MLGDAIVASAYVGGSSSWARGVMMGARCIMGALSDEHAYRAGRASSARSARGIPRGGLSHDRS